MPRPLAVVVEMTRRPGEKARACGTNSRRGKAARCQRGLNDRFGVFPAPMTKVSLWPKTRLKREYRAARHEPDGRFGAAVPRSLFSSQLPTLPRKLLYERYGGEPE